MLTTQQIEREKIQHAWFNDKRSSITITLPLSTVRKLDKLLEIPHMRGMSRASILNTIIWNSEEDEKWPWNRGTEPKP